MTTQDVILSIGIPAILGAFIYIGRKLQILDDLKITSNRIKANVKVVSDFLIRNNTNFDPSELQAFSPLHLTEKGTQLIGSLGFDTLFETHKEDFFRCIDSEKPRLKYDVEIAAIKAVSMLYDKEYMSFLKVLFYNNPNRNLENTAPTLGIYVRDKYLEEHPEIVE